MLITDFLRPTSVVVGMQARTKADVLTEIADLLARSSGLEATDVHRVLAEREALASTGIGSGVALPHGRTRELERLVAVVAISTDGVDFEAQDNQPVHIFVGLLAPQNTGDHLKALARVSRLLRQPEVRARLVASATADEAYAIITNEDAP
ncbi:MAG: PTS sugar transporter subunit IIA [Deltaproteobacteria bacterium]|nr:PTS sugar transporter subunit IIA [Deltaproteobacteria bacterium]